MDGAEVRGLTEKEAVELVDAKIEEVLREKNAIIERLTTEKHKWKKIATDLKNDYKNMKVTVDMFEKAMQFGASRLKRFEHKCVQVNIVELPLPGTNSLERKIQICHPVTNEAPNPKIAPVVPSMTNLPIFTNGNVSQSQQIGNIIFKTPEQTTLSSNLSFVMSNSSVDVKQPVPGKRSSCASEIIDILDDDDDVDEFQTPVQSHKSEPMNDIEMSDRLIMSARQSSEERNHPAPLPSVIKSTSDESLRPPAPNLSVSTNSSNTEVCLVWTLDSAMYKKEDSVECSHFEIYSYEVKTAEPPSTDNWKKVGEVRATQLPMQCKLSSLSRPSTYHFAVRAMDTRRVKGDWSDIRAAILL